MSSTEVREVIASLSEGDEIEVITKSGARIIGTCVTSDGKATGNMSLCIRFGDQDWNGIWPLRYANGEAEVGQAVEIRVLRHVEPPVGTPVWWDEQWWAKHPEANLYYALDTRLGVRAFQWEYMEGAVPATTPEKDGDWDDHDFIQDGPVTT